MTMSTESIVRLIKRSKRTLIVVGSGLIEKIDLNLFDYVIQLSKLINAPVVASANTAKEFLARNFKIVAIVGILELVNLLKDKKWQGFDGKGTYDTVIFLGILYPLASQALSALKNFAPVVTLNIDQYYQPNATYSYPNLTIERWMKSLTELYNELKKQR